jgi:hypothetical protein
MPAKPNTPEQFQQAVDAVAKHGTPTEAARVLGIPAMTLRSRWVRAKSSGYKPSNPVQEKHPAPDGYLVKGTSTLVDDQGQMRLQWIKTHIDEARFKAMVAASCRAAAQKVKPLQRVKAPRSTAAQLATLYTITDFHLGMLAWPRETGAPWDLGIAERTLMNTMAAMIEAAPPSELALFNQLGDFLHFDSMKPITPEHGHLLDADSRYQKIVEAAVRVIEHCVLLMLLKHRRVQVDMHEGNHDPAGSIWMRVFFARLFAGNPRVAVEKSPRPYVAHQHGKTMLGFHHGHLTKNDNLPLLFAAMFPDMWGATAKRYIHTGHRHHVEEKEHPGVKVIQHPTLAAPDAYAARGGWVSERQATSMTYHVEAGEVSRGIFLPSE